MIKKYNLITEIDDTEFNRMFDDCIDNLNAGSYPFEHTPVADGNNEAKRAFIKTQFQSYLDDPNGVVFVYSEDGYACTMSCGFVEGTHFIGTMILIGRNQAGSKSFMHDIGYHQAREAFWDEVNYQTWDFQTMGPGTAFFDHIAAVYNDTVENNPEWIQNARSARLVEGDMAGTIVSGANTEIDVLYVAQENELGNSGLKLSFTTTLTDDTGAADEAESEDDEERLQWEAGTHPDQNTTE